MLALILQLLDGLTRQNMENALTQLWQLSPVSTRLNCNPGKWWSGDRGGTITITGTSQEKFNSQCNHY